MTTGEKLKIWAKSNFGQLKKLAEVLEFSQENLSAYISGRRDPGAPFLRKIRKLGCDLNWLLDDEMDRVSDLKETYGHDTELQKLREENRKLKEKLSNIEKLLNKK